MGISPIGGKVGLMSNCYVLDTCTRMRAHGLAGACVRAHANPSHNTLAGALARARAGALGPYPSKRRVCMPWTLTRSPCATISKHARTPPRDNAAERRRRQRYVSRMRAPAGACLRRRSHAPPRPRAAHRAHTLQPHERII